MKILTLSSAFLFVCQLTFSQTYPEFDDEIPVIINGLTFDAMEPSISADGNYLFFNNLNNGVTTSLFYAIRVNDSTFTYIGPLTGVNQAITPRLDAVASTDSANNFFWVSTRNYPTQFDNYFHGKFNGTDITNIGRIHGSFYINTSGWIVMDAAINYNGTLLYYCNAFFNSCAYNLPCLAQLGIAQKQNDSTFNKLNNSDILLQNVNNPDYLVYAPNITKDGLELYYTRILKSNPIQSEICVAVRISLTEAFSTPSVIDASAKTSEAPSTTTDKSIMYFHRKEGELYKIFLRFRKPSTGVNEGKGTKSLSVCPNPSSNLIRINLPNPNEYYTIDIYSMFGQKILQIDNSSCIDISNFRSGVYILTVKQGDMIWTTKVAKQ